MRTEIVVLGGTISPTLREYAQAKLEQLRLAADVDILRVVVRCSRSGLRYSWEATLQMQRGAPIIATQGGGLGESYEAVTGLYRKLKRRLSERKRRAGRRGRAEGSLDASGHRAPASHEHIKVSQPVITVSWTPEAVSEFDYAEVVAAIAAIVRDEGGIGVQRIRTGGCGIPVDSGVLV